MLARFVKQIIFELRAARGGTARQAALDGPQPESLVKQARELCAGGRREEAEAICAQRISAEPHNAMAYAACGEVALAKGERVHAENLFRQALARQPELVEALLGLGQTLYESKRPQDALSPLSAAVRLAPTHAESLNSYGLALLGTGNALIAGWQFRQAVKLAPNDASIQNNLGVCAQFEGNLQLALKCFLRALQLKPDYATAHSNAGLAFRETDDAERALEHAVRATQIDPKDPTHLINLGVIHQEMDRLDEAQAAFQAALAIDPNSARALHGLGGAAFARDDRAGARRFFLRAAEKDPDFPHAIASLGEVELAEGDFAQGWKHYEQRLKVPESGVRFFPYPQWDGSPLPEGRLLAFSEQGIGDLAMFAGPLDEVRTRVGKVILGCPARAVTLFQRSYPWLEAIPLEGLKLPENIARRVTHQIPIASLMQHFRTSPERFPKHQGYLVPDPERVANWRNEASSSPGMLRLGLSWMGGGLRTGRSYRSIPLERLSSILKLDGVRAYSLQHFKVDAEVEEFRRASGIELIHDSEVAWNLEDLCALIASLDIVVTVCSTVAHLAGALGKPCIVLAPTAASWRYLRYGEKLPWYPSVRVLRQIRRGSWDEVLERAETLVRQAAHQADSHRG